MVDLLHLRKLTHAKLVVLLALTMGGLLAFYHKLSRNYSQSFEESWSNPASAALLPGNISLRVPTNGSLPTQLTVRPRTIVPKKPPKTDFTFTLYNTTVCDAPSPDLFLLVMVHSAPAHFLNRKVIRETWGNQKWRRRQKSAVLFVIGTSINPAVQAKVKNESGKYGDIVQYGFFDTYRNMTYKNLAGLTYISQFCSRSSHTYILKTDDDMFVYLRPIVSYLRQQAVCSRHIQKTVLCAEHEPKEVVQRNPKSKWFIPWEDFLPKHYPPYCYGGGYILTRDLVSPLLDTAKTTPFYWIDDVFVSGIAAERLGGVKHVQLPEQHPILGYVCDAICMQKKRRWFIHTLQRPEMIKNYYRVVREYGLVQDAVDEELCDVISGKSQRKPTFAKVIKTP